MSDVEFIVDSYNHISYVLSTTQQMVYADAERFCADLEAVLAVPLTLGEIQFLKANVVPLVQMDQVIWLGMADRESEGG